MALPWRMEAMIPFVRLGWHSIASSSNRLETHIDPAEVNFAARVQFLSAKYLEIILLQAMG